jgi:hypothetical protein
MQATPGTDCSCMRLFAVCLALVAFTAGCDSGQPGGETMATALVEQTHNFSVYASYHQFYLADRQAPHDEGRADFWSREAFAARLAVSRGLLGIGTESAGDVTVAVEVRKTPPPEADLDAFDHVVEGPLHVTSGRLIVHGVDDVGMEDSDPKVRARQFSLPPGDYRVRMYGSGFATVANEEGDDAYRLVLWPAPPADRRVLKQAPVPGGGGR